MTKMLKKLFGGLNLTWPKLIIAAIIAGVYTAAMAIIPALHYTSFITITATFEVWILFGILIIMNSRSNPGAGRRRNKIRSPHRTRQIRDHETIVHGGLWEDVSYAIHSRKRDPHRI